MWQYMRAIVLKGLVRRCNYVSVFSNISKFRKESRKEWVQIHSCRNRCSTEYLIHNATLLQSEIEMLSVSCKFVASSILSAHPVTARLSVGLGSDALEYGLDVWPRLGGSARHEGGAVASSVFTPADSTPDEMETFGCQRLAATLCRETQRERKLYIIMVSQS